MTDDNIRSDDEIIIEQTEADAKIRDIIQNIDRLMQACCDEYNIEDMRTASQQVWTGILKYVRFNYMKPTKCLYKYSQGISNDGLRTCMYDDYIVSNICDYYMYLCSIYGKVCNPYGFYGLTGIELDTIASWANMERQRPQAFGTVKKLRQEYESSLENGAQSGRNPVGYIATLNHRFGWQADSKPQLTVNITRTKDEIMASLDHSLIEENP